MLLICILFGLAYIVFVAAVCINLRDANRQIEADYPLIQPPA